ncbi:MAG TPA: pseudouridine synthase [Flavobacteriaceae bacterium]|nr:pseudouridine synthase [Flavobacteriaceae bacterium]
MVNSPQHFALFKPDGYISQFISNQKGKHKKKFLGEFYDFPEDIMAVGRLDEASEGLLLLTTNGKVSYFINSSAIEKEYFAQVDGVITDEAIEQLEQGIELSHAGEKYFTKPCKAKMISTPNLPKRNKSIRSDRHGPTSWVSLTLTEGKYRQVRKMTAAVGFPTLRLVRVRIGNYKIGQMKPGEVRPIDDLGLVDESILSSLQENQVE